MTIPRANLYGVCLQNVLERGGGNPSCSHEQHEFGGESGMVKPIKQIPAKLCKSEQRARIAFSNNVALDGESERY